MTNIALPIRRGRIAKAQRLCLYGIEGLGKTTLAAKFPNPVFLDTERGSEHLDVTRLGEDCGEDVVPKIVKNIVLQPGEAQAAVYRTHLYNPPTHSRSGRELHPFSRAAVQINILRQIALCPHAKSLSGVHSAGVGPKRSWTDFNPKIAASLSIIADVLEAGEQIMVGSPFREFSCSLHMRLVEAGVSSLLLDGETEPVLRGELADRFKHRKYSVLIVGLTAMGEGNSFENCSHLILPSRSWSYSENEQFINRVWRITSPKPVHIYGLTIANTIDEVLEDSFLEKSASAQVALDGRAFIEQSEDVDLETLLSAAVKRFTLTAETIRKADIKSRWENSLKARLQEAEQLFQQRQ